MLFRRTRVALRTLARHRSYTSVVVVSLGLAIALNTTLYSVLDALMFPTLEMRAPERLLRIQLYGDRMSRVDMPTRDAAVRAGMHTFSAITHHELLFDGRTLIQHGQTYRDGYVAGVAANYFDVLGARPVAGRFFRAGDEQATPRAAVISTRLAAALFPRGGAPVGEGITIDRDAFVVVGVAPDRANFPHDETAVWTVTRPDARGAYVRIIRLRDGASRDDAARELTLVSARIAAEAKEPAGSIAFRIDQVSDPGFQLRDLHVAMMIAVVAVLFIACANVANIQLARGLGRQRELALRSALGANRNRLVTDLMIESGILVLGGLLLGLIAAQWMSSVLAATVPSRVAQYIVEPQWSWRVLAASILATTGALVLVGVVPAIAVSRVDPNELLKSAHGTGANREGRRRYSVLVAAEIALALSLSAGAAVMMRAAAHAGDVHGGYDPHPLVSGYVVLTEPPDAVRQQPARMAALVERLRALPGVEDAAATATFMVRTNLVTYTDDRGAREFAAPAYVATVVSPSYFRTLRLPIVRGDDFLEGQQDEPQVIVDTRTARLLWPLSNPVGRRIKLGRRDTNLPYARVVGVVGEQTRYRADEPPGMGMLNHLGRIYYLPGPRDTVASRDYSFAQFVLRAAGNPTAEVLAVHNALAQWPDFRRAGVASMDDELTAQRASSRFIADIFALFSVVGLGLAAFGVYGVVVYSVTERRREIGVRVALGASARDVLRVVLRESLVVALAGIAVGLLLTKYGVELLRDKAWGDDVYNAPLFALIALLLLVTAVLSAYVPARRATRIQPTEALRSE